MERKTWKLSADDRAIMPSLYERGWTTARIASTYGITQTATIALLRRRGVVFRPPGSERLLGCDDAFFRLIDSDATAYWLGFLWADGTMNAPRGMIAVSLAMKDAEHLERLRRCLRIKNRALAYRYGVHTFARVVWTSHEMVADLTRYGLVTPRNAAHGLPEIPAEWLGSFIRGYFDGDGTVGIYRVRARAPYGFYKRPVLRIFSRSRALLLGIAVACRERGIHVRVRPHKTIFQMECDARCHIRPLRDWMYGGGGPCLHRKRSILRRV